MRPFTSKTIPILAILTFTALAAERPADADPPPGADQARAAFERIKSLAGTWRTRSTKGWSGGNDYRVIGRGSAVLGTSSFTDVPEAGMATVFHLDGDRLMLTHYCEAGNQPRLVASEIGPDAKAITFTFLDATNLASPDAGHMGHAVYRFHDDDGSFTSRWSFFKNREVVWAEDISYDRVEASETAVASPSP